MSEKCQAPEGYKITELGFIPKEWEVGSLDNIAEINPKNNVSHLEDNSNVTFLPMQNVGGNGRILKYETRKYGDVKKGYTCFSEKDILFAKITPCMENGKGALAANLENKVGFGSTEYHVLRSKPNGSPEFIFYITKWEKLRKEAEKYMIGSAGQRRVSKNLFFSYKIPIPTFPEQQKIAIILNSVDDVIQATQAIVNKTCRFKQGLLQWLLTCGINNTHFKKTAIGEIPEYWNVRQIGDLVKQVRKPVSVEKEAYYQEIGIRSHGKGIFHKTQKIGKELGNKRVFWVEPNCLILNIVFAWERAVAATNNQEIGMIASHRFPMFRPDEDQILLSFIVLYLNSSRGANALQSVSPGGAGRNKTLNQKEFLKLPIPVPPLVEQKNIVEMNNKINVYLEIEQRKLETLIRIKNGLMNDLLSGRVRVKLNKEV